jgi:hypothetical protein
VEVSGDWRKLYNEELHDFYVSPDIIRVITVKEDEMWRMAGVGKKRNAYRVLMGKAEGKRPLG